MSASEGLIKWKTDAWKDPNMVAWYAQRMVENTGTLRLNHQLEIGYCAEFATGTRLLDVGIGTGRGSLPLARKGFKVTGVDSSRAMLDETKRQAKDTPIELLEGDVRALPVPDNAFDTVMALNVMTHFPNWEEILAHWASKAVEGGTIIFDVYSLDHINVATKQNLTEQDMLPTNGEYADFNLRIKIESLVEEADRLGLTIKRIIPFRGFMSGADMNLHIKPTLDGELRWERLLSWLAEDDVMLDFSLFLERSFFAHLTTLATGKFMVVLEKRGDAKANAEWLKRNSQLNKKLQQGITLNEFAKHSGQPVKALKQQLNAGLKRLRNCYLFYRIIRPAMLNFAPEVIESYLDADNHKKIMSWFEGENADEIVMQISQDWPGYLKDGRFRIGGVDVSTLFNYFTIQNLTLYRFDLFKGERL